MINLPHLRQRLYHDILEENLVYHIYNRSNNKEVIFPTSANCLYFMTKLDYHLGDYLNIYAYCLLPNHFHLLVGIKSSKEIHKYLVAVDDSGKQLSKRQKAFLESPSSDNVPRLISSQFRRFFIAYSQMFNKMYGRHGSVFQKPFKRLLVVNPEYMNYLLYYIHTNPQKHGLVDDFREWAWSSYHAYQGFLQPWLNTHEPTSWFENREALLAYHQQGPYGVTPIPESWLEGDSSKSPISDIPVLD